MTGTRLACGAGGVLLTLATLGAASGPTMRAITPTPAATPAAAEVPSADSLATREAPAFEPAYAFPISDAQWAKITATGTWRPGCPVGRAELTNVSVPFFGMDGKYRRGTVTVNSGRHARRHSRLQLHCGPTLPNPAGPADRELRRLGQGERACGQHDRVQLPKALGGKCPGGGLAHANGRAIDINPWENPWIQPGLGPGSRTRTGPGRGARWRTRSTGWSYTAERSTGSSRSWGGRGRACLAAWTRCTGTPDTRAGPGPGTDLSPSPSGHGVLIR